MKVSTSCLLLKTSVIILIFAAFPLKIAIPVALFVTWVYQYIVALFMGVKVMPTMDMVCFYTSDKSTVNFMSNNLVEKYSAEQVKPKIKMLLETIPKSRYSIVEIMGDLYYKPLSVEEALKYVVQEIPETLENDEQVAQFIEKHINEQIPFSQP